MSRHEIKLILDFNDEMYAGGVTNEKAVKLVGKLIQDAHRNYPDMIKACSILLQVEEPEFGLARNFEQHHNYHTKTSIPKDVRELTVGGKTLREYHIWSEGFAATGQSSTAILHGKSWAENFQAACDLFAARNPSFAKNYNADSMTFWGCRLFEREGDARETFG